MFGKKKIENQFNIYDEIMKDFYNELADISSHLGNKVINAYIKAQAVTVYLENTPDWEQAIADRNKAQHSLRCSIGEYDSKRAEILMYLKENNDKFNENWSEPASSHFLIEKIIENYFTKK